MENKIQTADKIINIDQVENLIITISSRENIYNVWDIALGNGHGGNTDVSSEVSH